MLDGLTATAHGFQVWHDEILASPAHPSAMRSTVSFETRFEDPFVLTWPNTSLTLSSQDDTVATIDANGIIQAAGVGSTSFDASFEGVDMNDGIEVAPAN